ncbi:hypothetical protein SK571_03805 [Lentzea sp. BCCO 10_0798]|uniref:Uncharacterized protein n=1 Tax=Lentzea kristufekii TaxID=3095430 RepID=A0ABU4TKW0_9PSEU|nr:hypothetical protein [Lentzea sp. BCCO 10_0798]MDX8048496.1 hypothetical protein [Lentzea sp. BCCO 10_0798]
MLSWSTVAYGAALSAVLAAVLIAVFPVSWQDTGSGVFALAASALLLGFGPQGSEPGRKVALAALLAAIAALVVDVYLY